MSAPLLGRLLLPASAGAALWLLGALYFSVGPWPLPLAVLILLQGLIVGLIGYGLGVGLASAMGKAAGQSELAFRLLWQTLVISGGAVTLICLLASLLSIQKVIRLEPAVVFKG